MKTKFYLAVLSLAAIVGAARPADAVIITNALWTFEVNTPADVNNAAIYPNPIPADVGSGNAGGGHAKSGTDWSTPNFGNGSVNPFSANTWDTGDYFQFQVSTLNALDIQVSFDQTRSGTGPTSFQLQYSTDGSLFTPFGSSYTVLENSAGNGGVWNSSTRIPNYTFNFDLSAVSAIENQPNVYFRLTSLVDPADTGTSRVDNFLVTSSLIPEPSTVVLFAAGALVIWHRGRSRKS